MALPPKTYQAYMLRLWRDGGQAPWRASLENTADGQRIYFGSVRELVCFLQDESKNDTVVAEQSATEDTAGGKP